MLTTSSRVIIPLSSTGCARAHPAGGSTSPTSSPDEFIAKIRAAMNEENPDTYLLGEVWEDGTTKIAYPSAASTCWAARRTA